MSEALTQVLLAFVSVAGAFTTALFTWLRHRDTQRLGMVEDSLREEKVKVRKSNEAIETFQKMVFELEYAKTGLKARLEVIEKEKEGMQSTIARLERHEESCNKELARLKGLLEVRIKGGHYGLDSGGAGSTPVAEDGVRDAGG